MTRLADDLLRPVTFEHKLIQRKPPTPRSKTKRKPGVWKHTSRYQMDLLERNRALPCAIPGCEYPRHIAPSGRCHSPWCTAHYKERSREYAKRAYNKRMGY